MTLERNPLDLLRKSTGEPTRFHPEHPDNAPHHRRREQAHSLIEKAGELPHDKFAETAVKNPSVADVFRRTAKIKEEHQANMAKPPKKIKNPLLRGAVAVVDAPFKIIDGAMSLLPKTVVRGTVKTLIETAWYVPIPPTPWWSVGDIWNAVEAIRGKEFGGPKLDVVDRVITALSALAPFVPATPVREVVRKMRHHGEEAVKKQA